ncbi:MAG TPA: hypothetical protein VJ814_10040 [Gaiellaceae bacterium]|nr:hypothetical protein [Gaiellaceae bacterium]
MLVAVAGGVFVKNWRRELIDTRMRATAPDAIRSAIADGAELPRAAFVLRWTPGPPGTRYSVYVTDERLTVIVKAVNLEATELRVGEEKLSALPAQARVLWQVRAIFPDGTPVATQTFVARIAP